MALTPNQTRVIDPLLTQVARGYDSDEDNLTGRELYPEVIIDTTRGKIMEFDKSAFLKYEIERAAGADIAEIQVGFGTSPIDLYQDALAGKVPEEVHREGAKNPALNVAQDLAINPVMSIMRKTEERDQAKNAQDPANYDADNKITLAGTDKWTDKVNSTPKEDIDTGKAAIRKKIGRLPNVLHFCYNDFLAAKNHPDVIAHFSGTEKKQVVTQQMLAEYFEVDKVVVGTSVSVDSLASDFADNWNATILAYVPQGAKNMHKPSMGYTYRLRGFVLVRQTYFRKSNLSWIYPVQDERQVNHTSKVAGYLIQGAST